MKGFQNTLKRSFITGLLTLTPLFLTIYIAIRVINAIENASEVILGPLAAIPGLGVVIFFLIILLVGFATRYYLGKRLFEFLENIFIRIPFIKSVYQGIKKVSQSLYSEDKFIIKKTVLVQYPQKDSYAIGFLTSELSQPETFGLKAKKKYYSVFIPTTPNPTSGFMLVLPQEEVMLLDMSTEEAMQFIISLGSASKNTVSQDNQ